MSCVSKESFEVALVNVTIAPIIDCPKSFLDSEVVGIFQVPFHLVCFQMKSNFFEYELTEGSFYAHR